MRSFSTGISTENKPVIDPLYAYVQLGPHAMVNVRAWAQEANHHKGINVGGLVLARSVGGDIKLFRAANQNLQPGPNETKACAEQIAAQKAVHEGFTLPIGLWASGPVQPDTQSGRESATLHMCGECRVVLASRPELDKNPNMLITTVHPDKDEYEIYTYAELVTLHDGGAQDVHHYVDPGFRKWEAGKIAFNAYLNSPEQFAAIPPVTAARLAITGEL